MAARQLAFLLGLVLAAQMLAFAEMEASQPADIYTVTHDGTALASFLDGTNVTALWLKGSHISWVSGVPNNAQAKYGVSSHCSAYVASVAERLGVYILRPPNYKQTLLATEQNRWLALESGGKAAGWQQLGMPAEAQAAANGGQLAVVSYANTDPSKPGHIAVVRPFAQPSLEALQSRGVQVAQAGAVNSPSLPASRGFSPSHLAQASYFVFARPVPTPLPLALAWRLGPSKHSPLYLVDVAPQGRLDAMKLQLTPSGQSQWTLAAAGLPVGEGTLTFDLNWFKCSIPKAPTQEPFLTREAGSATASIDPAGRLFLGEAGMSPRQLSPLARTSAKAQIQGLAGLWYAVQDDCAFGLFITRAQPAQLHGYFLGYEPTALPRASQWLVFSASLEPGRGSLASLSASGLPAVLSKCMRLSRKGQQCVDFPASLGVNGTMAYLQGVPGVEGPLALLKATQAWQPSPK